MTPSEQSESRGWGDSVPLNTPPEQTDIPRTASGRRKRAHAAAAAEMNRRSNVKRPDRDRGDKPCPRCDGTMWRRAKLCRPCWLSSRRAS
jgi:hypothetical protein